MNDHSLTPESTPPHRNALKIAGLYLLIGGLWILFSDQLALILTRDPILLHRLSIFKGWGFIVTTALLLYWLIRRYTAGLSQSEARYRSLFQSNHSVMLLIDPASGAIVDANPSACAFYGYSHPEITGLKITDINQLSREQLFVEMERARQEERRQFFFRHRLAGGNIREVEVYSGPIEVQDQQLLYSIVHDITERKLVEEQFRLVVETAHSAFLLVNQDHRITLVNGQAEALFGYSRDELIGQSVELLIPPPVRDQHHHYRETFFAAPQTQMLGSERNIFGWHKEGRLVPLQVGLTPFTTTAGTQVLTTIIDLSERQQAEAALRESEAKHRTLLEALADGVFVAQDYQFVFANPALPAMLGYTPEAFVGLPFEAVIAPEFLPVWIERFTRRVGSGPEPLNHYEVRFLCNGGERSLQVELRANRIEYQGRPAVMGVIRDITERKLAEQQLRYQASLLQNVSDAIIATDLDFKITSWNQAAAAIYGWSAAEVMGRSTADLFQVEYNNFQPVQIDQDFQAQGFWQGEVTQKSKSGAIIQIMASVSLIRDSQGRPMGVVAVNRDITAYRQAEVQLQQATIELIFLNDLLKHSTQAISVANMQGRLVRFNHAFEQLTGYQEEELLQLTYEQLTPEPWRDIEARHIATLLATGQAVRFEKEYRRKDETVTPVELVIELYRDTQGQPLYTYGFATDITERKRAEQEIQTLARFPTENPNPVLRVGLDGRLLYANPASAPLLEFWRCLPGEDVPPEWQDHIAAAAAAQTHLNVDVTCGPQTYAIQIAPFVTDGYVNFYGQDITQREQARAALRESEERLAFALEVSQMGSWEFNLADHSAYRSLQHARIFGYETPEQAWTFELFLGHIIPEDRAGVERTIGQAIAAQSGWSSECRIRRCDGEIRWIWVVGRFRNDLAESSPKMVGGIVLDITERKLAEEALQESERRYRELVQNANSAIIRWKRNGDITFFNEFAQSFFGYRPDQIIGQKVNILVPATESTGSDLSMLVENILAHPEQYVNYVNENVCRDGRRVWMAWTNKPIYEHGRVEEILAVGMDVTARQQAEEKLRELQSMLATAEAVAGMGSWKWDLQTQKVSWSDEMFNLFGVDQANFDGDVGRVIASRIHPDDVEAVNESNRSVLEAGQPTPLEYRIVLPDGRQRHVWAEGTLIRDSSGRPVALTGYVQDITARKQVEAQIQAHARRLQTLADASHAFAEVSTDFHTVLNLIAQLIADHLDAGCVTRLLSEDGQWLEAVVVYDRDPAALEITESIIKNNTRYHLINDAPNPAVRALRLGRPLLLPALDPEQMRPFYPPEVWSVLAPYCPRSALIAPLQIQKQALGVLSLSRYRPGQPSFNEDDLRLVQDLADRAALALSNARLFGQVQGELAERKRAEEDLRRTATDLARSNADLEQFAYAASHDLQEPLRGVAGMLTLLQHRYGGQLDERADEFIRHAVEGASRMQTLINDLLVLSRVGTRGQPFQPVELSDVLADVKANLTVAIRESEAAISYDDLPTVVADRTQLIQLFQNLIGNAIKFRGDRTPEIRIKAEQQNGEWVFAVADNGIGLETKDFERIFGVFQRLHTRREYPGTGIGLALCKKIVERHGGRIWVESQPGEGATFYFTLS